MSSKGVDPSLCPTEGSSYRAVVEAAEKFASLGRRIEEQACWERASDIDPKASSPLIRLGNAAHQSNEVERALQLLERSVTLAPSSPEAAASLANVLYTLKRFEEARREFERSMLVDKEGSGISVQSLNNLALCYTATRQYPSAIRSYRLAWRLLAGESRSTRISILLNLGNAFVEGRQYEQGVGAYRLLLRYSPQYAVGYYSLARALDRSREWSTAELYYNQSLALDPTLLNSYSNLGVLYLNTREPERAVGALEAAVSLGGGAADLNNLGDAYGDSLRYHDAMRAYRQALDATESKAGRRFFPKALYSLLHYLIHTCDFEGLEEACEGLEATINGELAQGLETGMTPIESLVLLGTYTDHSLLAKVTHNFALRSLSRIAEDGKTRFHTYIPRPKRHRLKLGYISGGLRHHPDGKNLQGVFSRHDRDRVEVHCFSLKRDGGTAIEQRLRRDCEHFHDHTDLSNFESAAAVNALGIHVLLDVNGYTGEGVREQRNIILALTPARIQVNFLAWVASSGAPFIQYLVSDPAASPPEFQADYSEKLLLFPHSYFPTDLRNSETDPPLIKGAKKVREARKARGLPEEGPLLSGFNQLWKIDAQLLQVWLSVLHRTAAQRSWLWLPLFPDVAQPNILKAAAAFGHGVAERIVWTPLFGQEEHISVKALASLQLDTYVYCGHTSGADILWAGVPTLTLPGIKQSARVGASLLKGLGLHRLLIARTHRDYADLATQMVRRSAGKDGGGDGWLGAIRLQLRKAKMTEPLFEVGLWVRAMERAVTMAWEMEEASLPPFHSIVANDALAAPRSASLSSSSSSSSSS